MFSSLEFSIALNLIKKESQKGVSSRPFRPNVPPGFLLSHAIMWAARARSGWGRGGRGFKTRGSQERPVLQEPSTSTWRPPFGAAASSSSDSRSLPQGQNSVPDLQVFEQDIQPIKSLRKDAPPVVLQRGRGSFSKLLAIASNPETRLLAESNLQEVIYAPGTTASKRSRFKLWCDLAERLEVQPFPLTPGLVIQAAGIFRAAGYRSGFLYTAEARQHHIRRYGAISGALHLAIQDAERGIARSIGPPSKAAEIRPEWWDQLLENIQSGAVSVSREPQEPSGGLLPWGLATGFLLREIELAVLTVGQVRIDPVAGTVTFKLGATKKDPQGQSAVRTRVCSCSRRGLISCPFCSADALLHHTLGRWGEGLSAEEANSVPLICTTGDRCKFVQKQDIVSALCKDSELLVSDSERLVLEEPSGHTFRRSGAKHLARLGLPLARIQFYGRWGGPSVLGYVEEAMEESPSLRGFEPSWDEMQCFLSQAIRNDMEPSLLMHKNLKASLEELMREVHDLRTLSAELEDFIRPRAVLNVADRVLHSVPRGKPHVAPAPWKTHCGWRWACTFECEPISRESEPKEGVSVCKKCLPGFDLTTLPLVCGRSW